jgi:nucleoside-diphosphate-sugar epimerase
VSAFAAQIADRGWLTGAGHSGRQSGGGRDFTDVRDMVRAYAPRRSTVRFMAYNIGAGRSVSIRWLLDRCWPSARAISLSS